MSILAIETTQEGCSAALKIGDTLFERCSSVPREHAHWLLPAVHELLKEAKLTLPQVDVLACSCGPGSFTGVRIGTAFIQGLSFGLNKPVVLVSTLRAAAQAAYRIQKLHDVFVTLDARMQEVYWGLFSLDEHGIMQAKSQEYVQKPEAIILPDGAWIESTILPTARDVAEIAAVEYRRGHFVSADEVKPVYIRNDVASKRSL